jgi:multiple sugar transport system permease protein
VSTVNQSSTDHSSTDHSSIDQSNTDQSNTSREAQAAVAHAKPKAKGPNYMVAVLLVIIIVATVFPFYWMAATSLKSRGDVLAFPPVFAFQPTFEHYAKAFLEAGVGWNVLNSLIVAVCSTSLALLIGAPAAYALSRWEWKGKRDLWFWVISNRFMSPIVVALPFYLIANQFGILNNVFTLVVIYLSFNIPIVVWISMDQFRSVPREIDEAAVLDGCSMFEVFWRIVLPLAMPGVVVSAILSFIFSWNEMLFALVLTRTEARTAPVAATAFMSGYDLPWGVIMATGTIIVLPVIIFGALVSRQLVQGLTLGAVK